MSTSDKNTAPANRDGAGAARTLLDGAGRRITPTVMRRGLAINLIAGALGMTWFAMSLSMPLTMYMERLHASGLAIGLIVTVQWLAMAWQVPSAILAERLPLRKPYWAVTALLHRIIWFLPPLVPLVAGAGPAAGWVMLGLVAVSSSLAHAGTASWFSWLADLIPEKQRGRFWGKRQSVTMTAFLVAMAACGQLLDRFGGPTGDSLAGFTIVFTIAAVMGCADIVIHLWVPEPRPVPGTRTSSLVTRIRAPFRNPDFLWTTLAFGAWGFAIGLVGSFGIIYLKREFGASYSHLSAVTIAASIGTIIAGLLWGRVIDHVGSRTFAAAMLVVTPLFGIVWFLMTDRPITLTLPLAGTIVIPQAVLFLACFNVPAGAFSSGVALSQMTLITGVTEARGRTMAMAVHWTLVGALGALGPLVGGLVMDHFTANPLPLTLPGGTVASYQHILILGQAVAIWFVALPCLLRTRQTKADFPVRALAGNPLRAASIIHNLVILGESASWRARARAVRRLGRKRTPFVVGELINRLEDPSSDVREAAAVALARIGNEEAITALVDKLATPNSPLAPEMARALRETRHPRGVDALLRTLQHSDTEAQRESARALGAIGDPRAAKPLLSLLRKTDDERVLTASSEALASLGELAAIHDIVPHMKTTPNPVLRNSLAVAVGDLLGKPGAFYPLLIKEQDEPGAETGKRLERLRGRIRAIGRGDLRDQTDKLEQLAERLELSYADGQWPACTTLLFDLALGLAALRHGVEFGPDTEAVIDVLIWRDRRFGVGAWFLNLLRERADDESPDAPDVDRTDILLGIHFITEWMD